MAQDGDFYLQGNRARFFLLLRRRNAQRVQRQKRSCDYVMTKGESMKNEARYKKVVIGSAGTPLPMWDGQNQTMGALAREADKVLFYTTHKDRSRSGSPDVVSESDRITTQDRVYA